MMLKKRSKVNKIVSIVLAVVILFTAMIIDLPDGSSEVQAAIPSLKVNTHIQNIDWCGVDINLNHSEICGTTGKSLRLEALRMGIFNSDYTGQLHISVRYFDNTCCTVTQDIKYHGTNEAQVMSGVCGTTGQSKPIEAVKIWITGPAASHYHIQYKAHVQNLDWQKWTYQSGWAGTRGQGLRLEALEILFTNAKPAFMN